MSDSRPSASSAMGLQPKCPGSITFLLVGLALLVTIAVLFVVFVPVTNCKDCAGERIRLAYEEVLIQEGSLKPGDRPPPSKPCGLCQGRARISLLKKWLWKP